MGSPKRNKNHVKSDKKHFTIAQAGDITSVRTGPLKLKIVRKPPKSFIAEDIHDSGVEVDDFSEVETCLPSSQFKDALQKVSGVAASKDNPIIPVLKRSRISGSRKADLDGGLIVRSKVFSPTRCDGSRSPSKVVGRVEHGRPRAATGLDNVVPEDDDIVFIRESSSKAERLCKDRKSLSSAPGDDDVVFVSEQPLSGETLLCLRSGSTRRSTPAPLQVQLKKITKNDVQSAVFRHMGVNMPAKNSYEVTIANCELKVLDVVMQFNGKPAVGKARPVVKLISDVSQRSSNKGDLM